MHEAASERESRDDNDGQGRERAEVVVVAVVAVMAWISRRTVAVAACFLVVACSGSDGGSSSRSGHRDPVTTTTTTTTSTTSEAQGSARVPLSGSGCDVLTEDDVVTTWGFDVGRVEQPEEDLSCEYSNSCSSGDCKTRVLRISRLAGPSPIDVSEQWAVDPGGRFGRVPGWVQGPTVLPPDVGPAGESAYVYTQEFGGEAVAYNHCAIGLGSLGGFSFEEAVVVTEGFGTGLTTGTPAPRNSEAFQTLCSTVRARLVGLG